MLTNDKSTHGTIRYDICRGSARDWVKDVDFDQEKLGTAVRILRRYHALRLLKAELYARLGWSVKRQDALIGAEAIYVHATELMRNIDDVHFLQDENAFLRASQGLVLSWMNRHREAHRRYNEAYGYLNQLDTFPMSLRFATIDGRRTETFLACVRTTARKLDQKTAENEDYVETLRQLRGFLYDAIAAVERANYKSIDRKPLTGRVIAARPRMREIGVDGNEPAKTRRAWTSRQGRPFECKSVRGAAIGLGSRPSLRG
jgi:hypothetical protein